MRRMHEITVLLTTACALLAIVGCGRTTTVGRARTAVVALSEYRLTPQKLTLRAGPLTVVVHNFGRLVHNLAITHDGHVEAETPPIKPGQSDVLSVYLPAGGYLMLSSLFDDQSLGIYGTLTVSS